MAKLCSTWYRESDRCIMDIFPVLLNFFIENPNWFHRFKLTRSPDLFNSNSETIFSLIEVCVNFNSPENKANRKEMGKTLFKNFFLRKTWSVMLVIISWRLPIHFRRKKKHKGFFNQFPWLAWHCKHRTVQSSLTAYWNNDFYWNRQGRCIGVVCSRHENTLGFTSVHYFFT